MKRFKLGFLAIIALIAISFTVASQTNLVKGSAFEIPVAGKCYLNATFTIPPFGSPSDGQCVDPSILNVSTEVDQTTCNGGSVFCCYKFIVSDCQPNYLKVQILKKSA